jgi:hypothetical protein
MQYQTTTVPRNLDASMFEAGWKTNDDRTQPHPRSARRRRPAGQGHREHRRGIAGDGIALVERQRAVHEEQEIADAAYFLGSDGLIAPGARWACLDLVLFPERLAPQSGTAGAATKIMWNAWRKRTRRRR